MCKCLRVVLGGLLLLTALGWVQTASACPDGYAGQSSISAISGAPVIAGSVPFSSPETSADTPSSQASDRCECGCELSCGASAGCAGHGMIAFATSGAGVDPGVAVAQFVWFSPSFSFLVPADSRPPRAAA